MIREVKNGVTYYRSTLLSCPHAFSTRHGGVSTKAHLATMNLGQGRGDEEENLAENYRRFLAAADLPARLVTFRKERITEKSQVFRLGFFLGAPCRIRTCDLPVRSRALYPLS